MFSKVVVVVVQQTKQLTKIDCIHSDGSSIFTIAFLIQQDRGRSVPTSRRMKSIQVSHMSSQLLHGSSTKRITGSDHHTEAIVKEPKANLANVVVINQTKTHSKANKEIFNV